jgi:thiamine-phosphate pyrophosphorylase
MIELNGRPAAQDVTCAQILSTLGPVSVDRDASSASAPAQTIWLDDAEHETLPDGIAMRTERCDGEVIDHLRLGQRTISIRSHSARPLAPVLAAFLAHGYNLCDALVLARAWDGHGWPTQLAHFPALLDTPRSKEGFADFPEAFGLYAVVPDSAWVERLAGQVPVVQLRCKTSDQEFCAREIRAALHAVEGTTTRLFVNDHWRLAIQYGAYGVHLGQEDINTADLDAIRRAGLRLGISTHGYYEMLRADAYRPSYIALGTIFATTTKKMPIPPQGTARLRRYVDLLRPDYPLVAIGGINLERFPQVLQTGVRNVAVVRAITEASDWRSVLDSIHATMHSLEMQGAMLPETLGLLLA